MFFILLWIILVQNSTGMDDQGMKKFLAWLTGQSQLQQSNPGQIAGKTEQMGKIYDLLNAQALMVEENIGRKTEEEEEEEEEGKRKRNEGREEEGGWGEKQRRMGEEGARWGRRVGQLAETLAEGMEEKKELQNVAQNWGNVANFELGREIDELKALPEELGQLAAQFQPKFDGQFTNKAIAFQIIDHFGDWHFEKRFLHQFLANSKEFYYSESVTAFFAEIVASEVILRKSLELIETAEKDETIGPKREECLAEIKDRIKNINNRLNLLESNLSKKLEVNVKKGKIENLLANTSLANNFAQNLNEKLTEIKAIANLEGGKAGKTSVVVAFVISQVEDAQTELRMTWRKVQQFAKKGTKQQFRMVKNILDTANSLKKLRKTLLQSKLK